MFPNTMKLLLLCLLLLNFQSENEGQGQAMAQGGKSSRTPQERAAHRHRVEKMIEVAEKEELLAMEWLMEDMDDEEIDQWKQENPEGATRFQKLSSKYSR